MARIFQSECETTHHRCRALTALCILTLTLAACRPPDSAYDNRGGPESLVDVSTEVVNLDITSAGELNDLSAWINRDQPTRAELYCLEGEPLCVEARQVLDLYGVPTQQMQSSVANVTLIYERILARDCNARYVDDKNLTNVSQPAFGCAIAANMVQQISNKQQIVRPNLMDYPDGEKAVEVYKYYQLPPVVTAPLTVDTSIVSSATSP
ncbi:MAG: CpaD family pilus assembly lipoprotein [Alphaproteobacteria bacterium]